MHQYDEVNVSSRVLRASVTMWIGHVVIHFSMISWIGQEDCYAPVRYGGLVTYSVTRQWDVVDL